MARVLIGWELGAGQGHIVKLKDVAAELKRRGHEVVVAVQQTSAVPAGCEVWQAPLWPALLTARGRRSTASPATFGDILVALGLAETGVVSGLLRAWDGILRAARPDLVVAEFAPSLLLAAAGRFPALAIGTGFGTPPAESTTFPSLTGKPAAHDERRLLDHVNRELDAVDRSALPALPAMLRADRTLTEVFRELDPYRGWRDAGDYSAPHIQGIPPMADGRGEELFFYFNGIAGFQKELFLGAVDSGLRIRMHDPRMSEAEIGELERAGITFERKPVPFTKIVERSRLVVSHGGLGLTCTALCAGLPHVIVPFDMEKRLTAAALVEAGLGASMDHGVLKRDAVAALLNQVHADDALAARARAAAPDFRARAAKPSAIHVADVVDVLARG
ncbi:hypothetical protein ACFB49_05020 [Sphingomonas sp. DBB INV C78]|uniref:glycosyltransferase n=1 Tax=Sphingomonas sp. DBB INV C78 TaxID=3349434 RepID=UPI0036D3A872